jgi:hypothetical protein
MKIERRKFRNGLLTILVTYLKMNIMKTRQFSLLIAALISLPAVVNAQQSEPTVTRAQLRQELAQLEHAGYHPGHPSPYYPADIQAAEAKVHASHESEQAGVGYSGSPDRALNDVKATEIESTTSHQTDPSVEANVGGVDVGSTQSGHAASATQNVSSLFTHR